MLVAFHVKETEPKFVILDMQMPEYDGSYAIKKIKNEDPHAKTIVLTAHIEYAFNKNEVPFAALKNLMIPTNIIYDKKHLFYA